MSRKRKSAKTLAQPKWLWTSIILGISIVIVIAFAFYRFTPFTEISASQAYQKYQQGTFFLDVRTQVEWDNGHLANSTLIPLDQLSSRLTEIPKDQDVVVICRSGVRAKQGTSTLREAGYTHAVSMTGGLLAWRSAGYPFEGNGP